MGKFPFKRPRIISKKFPEVTSSIDGVTKSLNDLVFSYTEKVDRALQKKHLMMAISSMVLLIVLGSFISPKGKAESSIFYPDTCLGGWVNPSHAQGELQTTSNGDGSQFTKDNSAVLPRNTDAEMYCGNFKGKFDETTKPTKILVSLALTKGEDLLLQETIVGDSFASSSLTILDTASTTDLSFTLATSTASSTLQATSTDGGSTTTTPEATSTEINPEPYATPTPVVSPEEPHSVIGNVIDSVTSGIIDFFNTTPAPVQTDTVVVPPPAPVVPPEAPQAEPVPETPPVSLFTAPTDMFLSYFFQTVFAEEENTTSTPELATSTPELATSTPEIPPVATSSGLFDTGTTSTTTLEYASSTDVGTSTDTVATSTDDNQFQNNFLEVLYTFDGVTWISLGDLNEISMKYRTFEIPVSTSTSWSDMGQLQIKIVSKKHIDETPTVYLDGIKVEVLYETTIAHEHPDFARDTILKDEIADGVRVLTIINYDTKQEEVWYMHLDEVTATTTLPGGTSTTPVLTSSTTDASTTLVIIETHEQASTTATSSSDTSTSSLPVVDLLKRTWKKLETKNTSLPAAEIIAAIKEQEKEEAFNKENDVVKVPNFALDTIKRMKGLFLDKVLIQIERTITSTTSEGIPESHVRAELWLYDPDNNTQEKIGTDATSTEPITVANDFPIGVKGKYVFWVSVTKTIVYAYNIETKKILVQKFPQFDSANGERGEIHFEEVPWKVIVGGEGFLFYSSETGEVFSDEDSRLVEQLRRKVGLDSLLNKEELSNLNLPVEAEQ